MPIDNPVTAQDPKSLALAAWDECCRLLPKNLVENLTVPQADPANFKKSENDFVRLRVLPRQKNPLRFWNSSWCFYEIAVGNYGAGLTVGGVAFIQFPNQKACGEGQYLQPVLAILEKLQAECAAKFELCAASHGLSAVTGFSRRYFAREFPFFPPAVAGRDMAWLIQKTLPQFTAISS